MEILQVKFINQQLIKYLILVSILVGLSIKSEAQIATNPDSLCSLDTGVFVVINNTSSYTVVPSPNYRIVKSNSNEYYLVFSKTGMVTITFISNLGLTYTKQVYVYTPMPYILLSQNLLCAPKYSPEEGGGSRGGGFVMDEEECQKVCDSVCIWYYAGSYVSYPGQKFRWVISGAYNYSKNDTITADSIEVCWGSDPYGSITLIEGSSGSCEASIEGCVEVMLSYGGVNFGILPDSYLDTFRVCQNQELEFEDFSTMRDNPDIESWCWDFGNGEKYCGNVELDGLPEEVFNYQYSSIGTYKVRLTYKTKCGCEKTKEKIVIVDSGNMMKIYCNSPVCHGQTEEYYTDAICPSYQWSVTNGTIVGSSTGSSVKIIWGDPSDGIGIVTLRAVGCPVCNPIVSLKISILPSHPKLVYPKSACAGDPITHTGIQMSGTKYSWSSQIHNPQIDQSYYTSKFVPSSSANRSQYVTGIYTMTLFDVFGDTMCHSDTSYSTTIKDTFHWIGPDTVCRNSMVTFSMSNIRKTANMIEVKGGNPTTTQYFPNTNLINLTFPNGGIYIIKAVDPFLCDKNTCTKLVYVPNVKNLDSVKGDTQVCLNTQYTYKVFSKSVGLKLNWVVVGGNLVGSSGEEAEIIFTTLGTKRVGAYNSMIASPFCHSDTIWLTIEDPIMKNRILGPKDVCANGFSTHTLEEMKGYDHQWSFIPDNASTNKLGSITKISDQQIKITWNDVTPQSVTLRVKYSHCGIIYTVDTLLNIGAPPNVTINGPSTICAGGSGTFTCLPSSGKNIYSWTGAGINISSPNAQMTNISMPSSGTYTLNISTQPGGCAATMIASKVITVIPKPNAKLTFSGNNTYCPPNLPSAVTVSVSVIGNGNYSFAYSNATLTPVTIPFSTNASGSVIVTDNSTGCQETTNPLNFKVVCPNSGCVPNPNATIFMNYTSSCNTATWTPITTNCTFSSAKDNQTGLVISNPFVASSAGVYGITLYGNDVNSCEVKSTSEIIIPLVPDLDASLICTGGIKKIVLRDKSTTVSPYSINLITWSITKPLTTTPAYSATGTGSSFTTNNVTSLPAGTYTLVMTATTIGGANNQTCSVTRTMVVSPDVIPTFTVDMTDVCHKNSVKFTLTNPLNVVNAKWYFGDGSSFNGETATRQYFNYGTSPTNQKNTYYPYVIITDNNGCIFTSIQVTNVKVNKNLFFLSNIPKLNSSANNICINQAPIVLSATQTYVSGFRTFQTDYLWNNTTSTTSNLYNVFASGRYHVRMIDNYGCEGYSAEEVVGFIPLPKIEMVGKANLCQGDPLDLYFDAGNFPVSVSLSSPFGTVSNNHVYGKPLNPGKYKITAVSSSVLGCTDTMIQFVNVFANPSLTINQSKPICSPYSVLLSGNANPSPVNTHSSAFLWGHGPKGVKTTVYQGGIYTLRYSDQNSCRAYDSIKVDKGLRFINFPEGCFDICMDSTSSKQVRFDFIFDRLKYDSWEWLRNGITYTSSTNSLPTNPLLMNINAIGNYNFVLKLTHNGCTITSPSLNVNIYDCCNFELRDSVKKELCKPGSSITLSPLIVGSSPNIPKKYVWFKNGVKISEESSINVSEIGEYKVEITIKGCIKSFTYQVIESSIYNIIPEFKDIHYSNTCPVSSFDLNTISPLNSLPGLILSWHTGLPANISNKLSKSAITSVGAGTYYAVFFNPISGCYSAGGDIGTPVVITIIDCLNDCNPIKFSPNVSLILLSNICPKVTADLTTVTSTNLSGNNILSWHYSSPATNANKVIDPTNVTAGSYYACFMDINTKCYANFGKATTIVTVTIGACGSPCNTVITVPNLGSNWIKNICPQTTVNLTSIIVKNQPLGLILTWHTGFPATNLNKVTNPTTISVSGMYYACFYDPIKNCYLSFGSSVTKVLAMILPCGPCKSGTESPKLNAFYFENTCPNDFVDISNIISTNLPSGAVLSWHTGYPIGNANKVTGSKIYKPGLYYVAFYDPNNNCFAYGGMSVSPVIIQFKDCKCLDTIQLASNKFYLCDRNDVTEVNVLIPKSLSGCIAKWYTSTGNLIHIGNTVSIKGIGSYYCEIICTNCKDKKTFEIYDCSIVPKIQLLNPSDWSSSSNLTVIDPQDPFFNPWIWSKQYYGKVHTGNPYPVSNCTDEGWYEVVSEKCILCPNAKAKYYFDPKYIIYK